jgi:glutathione synthase/RimK-type ligase-like ATP-grasp enzyme
MNTGKLDNARLLVVSTNTWPSAGQVASALALAGFQVAIVCPSRSPAYRLRKLRARFPYRSSTSLASINSAIAAWLPDVIVCADDEAVRGLHYLYFKASQTMDEPNSKRLMNLIESSLGSCRGILTAMSKSEVSSLAKSLGIACPRTTILTDRASLAREESGVTFPVIIKTDDASGGLGTRVANNRLELRAAIVELSLPYNWPFSLKRLIGRCLGRAFCYWLPLWPRKMGMQQYVAGRPCNRAVVCWNGKVLAGITVDVLATSYEFGPATLVKVIDHPDVTAAAEKIVAELGLSGFIGFDFILDSGNNAWFLEVNPRATPICHICANGQDLAGSLFILMTGMRPRAVYHAIHQDTFTLFPGVPLRAKRKVGNINEEIDAFDDAPDDEPEFVRACRAQKTRRQSLWLFVGRSAVCC